MPVINMLDSLTYSLVGEDRELFQFDPTTGEVSYPSWFTPSYADVWDWDRDHIYEMAVVGRDSAGTIVTRHGLELAVPFHECNHVWYPSTLPFCVGCWYRCR